MGTVADGDEFRALPGQKYFKARSNRLLDHLVGARYEVDRDPVTDGWRGRKLTVLYYDAIQL